MGGSVWGWLSRPKPPPRRASAFDAVVDLAPGGLPIGAAPEEAMVRVRLAVEAIAGASRVRVRLADGDGRVRVFPAGRGVEGEGAAWAELRARVGEAVRTGMASPAAPEPPWPAVQEPRPAWGFGEAPQPALQADALAELALLAQSLQQSPVAPPPPLLPPMAAPQELDRLLRLLAFVLPQEDRRSATTAIARFGSFAAVLAAPETELRRVPGFGDHSVAAIKLVHEAAVRLARAGVTGQPVLDDKAGLDAYLAAALARERVEQFRILFLDGRGMLKADEVQATGTVNHTPVYPREVVRRALELDAAALVLVHNHPSGDPTPSADDIAMTGEIARAATALGVVLRDHIIVGNGRTLSFAEAGLLDGG